MEQNSQHSGGCCNSVVAIHLVLFPVLRVTSVCRLSLFRQLTNIFGLPVLTDQTISCSWSSHILTSLWLLHD